MKRFMVYYKSQRYGDNAAFVKASDASVAVNDVRNYGINQDGETVPVDRVVGVKEVG